MHSNRKNLNLILEESIKTYLTKDNPIRDYPTNFILSLFSNTGSPEERKRAEKYALFIKKFSKRKPKALITRVYNDLIKDESPLGEGHGNILRQRLWEGLCCYYDCQFNHDNSPKMVIPVLEYRPHNYEYVKKMRSRVEQSMQEDGLKIIEQKEPNRTMTNYGTIR
jgi:hypothetical protein